MVFGGILSLRARKAPGPCCPPARGAGSFCLSQRMLPGGDLLNQHGKISHQVGVRANTAIHRGKVLTFVEGNSSLLAAAAKFIMKQTLRTPQRPGTLPQVVNQWKNPPVLGDSLGSGSLEGSSGHGRQVQAPKPPWYLTEWEHGDRLACWNGMLTHRERTQLLHGSYGACLLLGAYGKSVGNWTFPLRSRQLFL